MTDEEFAAVRLLAADIVALLRDSGGLGIAMEALSIAVASTIIVGKADVDDILTTLDDHVRSHYELLMEQLKRMGRI